MQITILYHKWYMKSKENKIHSDASLKINDLQYLKYLSTFHILKQTEMRLEVQNPDSTFFWLNSAKF